MNESQILKMNPEYFSLFHSKMRTTMWQAFQKDNLLSLKSYVLWHLVGSVG